MVGWCHQLDGHEFAEKAMAPHSSTLAWKIPWMEEPGELQSMGLQSIGVSASASVLPMNIQD